jgi:uncharacterized protein (TIGR00661 family)
MGGRAGTGNLVKIFYGICGEGMGHTGRSLALIERLEELGHRVTIFTFADAFGLLANSGYQPIRISGLQFGITAGGGVSPGGTAANFVRFMRCRRESIDLIRQMALAERPDLVITDFEPLTAIAAESLGIECISVDNQHRFCEPLGAGFPLHLRAYGSLAGSFVERWIKQPWQCIVAVFHRCPASRKYRHVDALLRRRFSQATPSDGDHILLYAKGGMGRRLCEIARTVPAKFIAYGCDGVAAPNIQYKITNSDAFINDLAACRGVLCTAGQQLIGEARYFGKPILVVPMPGQHEQEINARYARSEGIGNFSPINHLTSALIEQSFHRPAAIPRPGNGLDQIMDLLGIGYG